MTAAAPVGPAAGPPDVPEVAGPVQETARLLAACQVPAWLAGPAVARLGATAAGQLREDPWRLLAVPQLRPDQADWFARRVLGREAEPQDPRRGRALVGYLLARAAGDGHTAVPATVIAGALGRFGISDPAAAIAAAVDDGTVLPFGAEPGLGADGEPADGDADGSGEHGSPAHGGSGDGSEAAGEVLLALARYAMAEEAVAEGLARLAALAEPLELPEAPGDGQLGAAQQRAVAAVAACGVSVLCGGWRAGADRVLAGVAGLAGRYGLRLALAAPTGQAASRLAVLAGALASTLHQLLGARASGAGWAFTRNEDAPLDADLIVVTGASGLDAELAAALVEACPDGSRLLLVGDPAELPPAGAGRVLADLIDSGTVPVTELTGPDGGDVITRLVSAVRGGRLLPVDAPGREVVVVPVRDSADAARRVVQLVTDSIPRALGIPAADVQVITPVREGAAGTAELNRALKARLNPGPGGHAGFDPGDRVVAVAGHPEAGFTLGDIGTVTGPGAGGLTIDFPAGPVCVPDRLLGDLRPGWALTTRRAQGSEWPAVVAVFPAEAAGLLSRPLAYTALTRAERHLSVVHGAGPALARAVATATGSPRVTRLAGLLAGEEGSA